MMNEARHHSTPLGFSTVQNLVGLALFSIVPGLVWWLRRPRRSTLKPEALEAALTKVKALRRQRFSARVTFSAILHSRTDCIEEARTRIRQQSDYFRKRGKELDE